LDGGKKILNKNGLLPAVRLQVWHWPAVINFTLSGAAGGFYLLNLFFGKMAVKLESPIQVAIYNLTAPLLVCLGFLMVAFEAGSPFKGIYLLNKLKTSWMSREVISGLLFICFAFSGLIFSHPVIKTLAGAAVIGLLFSQGFLVYRCCAVTAWNKPIIPVLFFVSGACLGFSLIMAWASITQSQINILLLWTGFILVCLDAAIWIVYLRKNMNQALLEGIRPLYLYLPLKVSIGLAYVLPATLLLVLISANTLNIHSTLKVILSLFAGTIIFCGGVYQKFALIFRANYFRRLTSGEIKLNAYRK
jgi:DMSO reductase anchor subunit